MTDPPFKSSWKDTRVWLLFSNLITSHLNQTKNTYLYELVYLKEVHSVNPRNQGFFDFERLVLERMYENKGKQTIRYDENYAHLID